MYAFGRRVYVKALDAIGVITERNYIGVPRRASYIVTLEGDIDFMAGSRDLQAADYCCDGCSKWRAGVPYAWSRDGEYERGLGFCFMCAGPKAQEEARRYQLALAYEDGSGW